MMAGSHVAIGVACWIAAAPSLGQEPLGEVALAAAALGALAPDVDHPKSWVGRRLRPVSDVLARLLGHRGATHSLLALAGFTLLMLGGGAAPGAAIPFAVGYLSHLAADLLTPAGLRLLWPLRGTWSLPVVRTGSALEPVVVGAVALALAWAAGT